MIDSRREVSEGRFRTLLLKWLAKLPADGWEGTSHQLGDVQAAFGERHRLFAFAPTCPGQKVSGLQHDIRTAGYAVTRRRRKDARTLRLTRC